MQQESNGAIYRAALSNVAIAIAKSLGALATGSAAMLSEAIHSFVDITNQLLLQGRKIARRAPDDIHPTGYGKAIYVNSLVVSVLVFVMGATLSFVKGVSAFFHPEPLSSAPLSLWGGVSVSEMSLNLAILGVGALFEGWAFLGALGELKSIRRGRSVMQTMRETKDPTIIVLVMEDGAALMGLAVASLGVLLAYRLDLPRIDALASILIAFILASVSLALFYKTRALLLGETAEAPVVARINAIILDMPGVACINEMLAMHQGPFHLTVSISIDVKDALGGRPITSKQVEALTSAIDREIKEILWDEFGIDVLKVFVEAQNHESHRRIVDEEKEEDDAEAAGFIVERHQPG